jgi:ABC-type dipeptide/oligopeptide/nickel transport system permease component
LYELDDFGESYRIIWKNLILPSFVLGIRPLAVITQLMRKQSFGGALSGLHKNGIFQGFVQVSGDF